MKKEPQFYWHIHHDILLEPLTEPIENRIKFIKENKPKDEIKLRLKLLKPVKGKLPLERDEVRQKYDEVRQKYKSQIEVLHKKECPNCPWTGSSIFPKK